MGLVSGEPFEVNKEVYERALKHNGYMDKADEKELFPLSILYGYGLYSCKVYKENDKYICHWSRGSNCD